MENQAAPEKENSAGVLYLAFELSRKKWKLGFSDGKAPQIRQVTIGAGDLEACREGIEKAKQPLGLNESVGVRSCYEAGRGGFWVHRAMEQIGGDNMVVDGSSIEGERRQRRGR